MSYRTDKAGIIHCTIGKASFEADALKDNLHALLLDLIKAKPATAKGQYLQKISLSSTMGPGVTVDQASLTLGSNSFHARSRWRRPDERFEGAARVAIRREPSKTAGAVSACGDGQEARHGKESPSMEAGSLNPNLPRVRPA